MLQPSGHRKEVDEMAVRCVCENGGINVPSTFDNVQCDGVT